LFELERRFPEHVLSRDARVLRIQVLLEAGRCSEAETAIAALVTSVPSERGRLLRFAAPLRAACAAAIERIAGGEH
jgi:hypothetical protein